MPTQLTVPYDQLTREAEALIRHKMSVAADATASTVRALHESCALGMYLLWSSVARDAATSAARSAHPATDALDVYHADRDRLEALTVGRSRQR
ncbi:hypothetical protein LGM58_37520 [Burkholderia contaminans]|uniref:hypothetical protein n=1 Tax=Burkholderia contaminans TaxID=488447 RepID=UPI001CF2F340|nr:hypothetical protein [Burkholderia contaminans]MCA7888882.1 hypothetical protein [Burkholderia contaminans]